MAHSPKNFTRLTQLAAGIVSALSFSCLADPQDSAVVLNNTQHLVKSAAKISDDISEQSIRQKQLSKMLAQSQAKKGEVSQRTIFGKVEPLMDASGLKYVGIKVNQADIAVYLEQLQAILKDDYAEFRQHQAARDMNSFHLTLLSPNEFQFADKTKIPFGENTAIRLIGLGKVEQEQQANSLKKVTYFIVAQSEQAQFFRQSLTLKNKDFHVTLGFKPSDIYGVRKGVDTLISQ